MSIMLMRQNAPSRAPNRRPDGELQPLLEHIAIELAAEYVRLIEAAAAVDGKAVGEEMATKPSEIRR